AALGQDLVLDVRPSHAGVHVELGGALDVEEVAVAAVHIHDDRRDLQMGGRDALFRIAGGHRELELPQRRDRAARAVGDLGAGVQIHVRRAEVPDGEGVTGEVDRRGAVVHGDLGAVRVVDAGREHKRFAVEQLAYTCRRTHTRVMQYT